jgi:hypothetical protein
MIVGALRDCGQIEGMSDVKADVYVLWLVKTKRSPIFSLQHVLL